MILCDCHSMTFPFSLLELIGVVEKVWDRGRFRNEVENTWRILLLCQVTWTSTFWKALKTYSPPEIKDIFRCPLSWVITKRRIHYEFIFPFNLCWKYCLSHISPCRHLIRYQEKNTKGQTGKQTNNTRMTLSVILAASVSFRQ